MGGRLAQGRLENGLGRAARQVAINLGGEPRGFRGLF